MGRYILFFSFFLFSSNQTPGQITFSKRYHFDFLSAALTSVIPTDSCYYATGIIADTIFPYRTGNIFAKLDLEGNVLFYKTIKDTVKTYETWRETLTPLNDNMFALSGYTIDNPPQGLMIKYNEFGDTIFTKQYLSFFHPEDNFIITKDFKPTPDNGFAFLIWSQSPDGINNNDISLLKVDEEGNEQWFRNYGTISRDEEPETLLVDDYGNLIIGGVRDNSNTHEGNYIYQTYILKTDGLGNVIWEYLSNSNHLEWGASDIELTPDGGMVIASGIGTEIVYPNIPNRLRWECYIYKLDAERELEWGTYFRDSFPDLINFFRQMITVEDGSGYVAVGNIYNPDWEEEGFDINGYIVKVSPEGDSLWARKYQYVESPADEHFFYDVKQTSDGGFIVAGRATDFLENPRPQQGWLVKLDEYGCLVPGCHLDVGTENEASSNLSVLLYPNPTTDYLNIYFSSPQKLYDPQFSVVNAQGQVLKRFPARANVTQILPIYAYPKGMYYLQLWDRNGHLSTKSFIRS